MLNIKDWKPLFPPFGAIKPVSDDVIKRLCDGTRYRLVTKVVSETFIINKWKIVRKGYELFAIGYFKHPCGLLIPTIECSLKKLLVAIPVLYDGRIDFEEVYNRLKFIKKVHPTKEVTVFEPVDVSI